MCGAHVFLLTTFITLTKMKPFLWIYLTVFVIVGFAIITAEELDANLLVNVNISLFPSVEYKFSSNDYITITCYTNNGIATRLSCEIFDGVYYETLSPSKLVTRSLPRLTPQMSWMTVTCAVFGYTLTNNIHFYLVRAQTSVTLTLDTANATTPTSEEEIELAARSTTVAPQIALSGSHNSTAATKPSRSGGVLLIVVPVVVVILSIIVVLWLAHNKCGKKYKKCKLEMNCQNLSKDVVPAARGGRRADSREVASSGAHCQHMHSTPLTKLNRSKNHATETNPEITLNLNYVNINNKQVDTNTSTLQSSECSYAVLDLANSNSVKFVPIVETYATIQQSMPNKITDDFDSHTSSGNDNLYENYKPKEAHNSLKGDHEMESKTSCGGLVGNHRIKSRQDTPQTNYVNLQEMKITKYRVK